MIKKVLLSIVVLVLLLVFVGWLLGASILFDSPDPGEPISKARPISPVSEQTDTTFEGSDQGQILFGDLHVHTSFSLDAAMFNTRAIKDLPYNTPADACDFARYCSALDFWSINDHAESTTPEQWQQTTDIMRQCDKATDPQAPDLVSFLGWEWSQGNNKDPSRHYGHKNVVLRSLDEGEVPTRPIGSANSVWRQLGSSQTVLRGLSILGMSRLNLSGYESLLAHMQAIKETPDCGSGDVRELPSDCHESVETPTELFSKLDQWGFDALVIPHGLSWGITNPLAADFANQVGQHNQKYQRLLEVYSGHGNSEAYTDIDRLLKGDSSCPAPANGFTPCCWQAGNIIQQRCEANSGNSNGSDNHCNDLAASARDQYVAALNAGGMTNPRSIIPTSSVDEWGQCDQATGLFQAAFNYIPKQSAQYILSLDGGQKPLKLGFIGASDNHSARPGSGYKEVARYRMTDTKDLSAPQPASDTSSFATVEAENMMPLIGDAVDAQDSFYFTGGLVAVHADGRSRDDIWNALHRRSVYGTSGPRINLWFDLVTEQGETFPMGSEKALSGDPVFRVGASGSLKQKPGCPAYVNEAMGVDRTELLCRNECFNPSSEAHKISRIEVVRILPRKFPAETEADLIQDPWKVIDCSDQALQCVAEFTDPEFSSTGREAAYYVRAIQEPTPTVNGDPFNCERDAEEVCMNTNYCVGVDKTEDCLSDAEHRAWSSPIYLSPVI